MKISSVFYEISCLHIILNRETKRHLHTSTQEHMNDSGKIDFCI